MGSGWKRGGGVVGRGDEREWEIMMNMKCLFVTQPGCHRRG